jgi:hypothetical protein
MMRKSFVRALSFFSFFALLTSHAEARKQVSIDMVITDQFEEHGVMRFHVDVQDSQGNVPQALDPENISFEIDRNPTAGEVALTTNKKEGQGTAVLLLLPSHGSFVTSDGLEAFKQIISGAQSLISSLGPADYHAIRFFNESGMTDSQDFTQDVGGAQRFLDNVKSKIVTGVETGQIQGSDTQSPRLLRKYFKEILKRSFNLPNLPRRKVILLYTEGNDQSFTQGRTTDNASGKIIKEANREAEYRNNTSVKIHVVGIEGFQHDRGLATFTKIAEQTGGTHLTPVYGNDFQEIADSFETMADRILRQHIIDWKTEEWDGGEATIRLIIKMSGNEYFHEVTDVWPERPSTWVGTFFTIFFWLLGIALFLFILMKIISGRKNRPVEEEDYGDSSLGARAVLLVVGGPNQGEELYLSDEVTTFGRSDACEVQFDDPTMSRRHAAIRIDSMRFELSDIKSASGTFVNGRRIEKCFLKDGDLIMLAETKLSFKLI